MLGPVVHTASAWLFAWLFAWLLAVVQPGPPVAHQVSATDSTRILRAAKNAQSAFEAFRRDRLPTSWSDEGDGTCDAHIGRYCYWRGDEDDDDPPPLETPAVRQRRLDLIQLLDSAARVLPGDEWIAGQRVRYLVDQDHIDEAIHAARSDCRAGASWCDALAGYAAHVGQRFATADSMFSDALATMDSTQRCHWFDVSDLLSDELADRFKRLDCQGREAFVRRVFWLGAPLYSVSATDLLTEHFARLTYARLSEHSASADGESWGDDMRELVMRYGWPQWYSRTPSEMEWEDQPSITGHDTGVPYDFLPSVHAFDHLGHTTDDDWHLADPSAQSGYAPTYARTIHALPNQLAVFRRGDSALVVAAWDAREDTTLSGAGRHIQAALVLASSAEHLTIARDSLASVTGHLSVVAPIDSGIASLELLAPSDRRAARARIGVPPRAPGALALSDLLLYAPGDSSSAPLADSIAAVAPSALSSDVIPGGSGVGVFWEVYGFPAAAAPAEFTVSVEQFDMGWLHRAEESVHLADPASELRVHWEEVPALRNGIAARAVRLDLSRLHPGHYRVELTVTSAGGGTAVATREIQVR